MGWSEDRWMATWAGPGIQDLYKCLFLGLRAQMPPRDELISPRWECSDPGGWDCCGGVLSSTTMGPLTEARRSELWDTHRSSWHYVTWGSQLPLGNERHAKTQALPWTHGQEGTQQPTEAQQSMHQPSSTPYIGNAQTGCSTKVPSDTCTWWCSSAWTQDAPNNVPWGLSHNWVIMRWGEDEHKCAKCTVTYLQILGLEHTWIAQKSPPEGTHSL